MPKGCCSLDVAKQLSGKSQETYEDNSFQGYKYSRLFKKNTYRLYLVQMKITPHQHVLHKTSFVS